MNSQSHSWESKTQNIVLGVRTIGNKGATKQFYSVSMPNRETFIHQSPV
jgi:hypothetical protein